MSSFVCSPDTNMEVIMYCFLCEDSPNGIFSGIYDAWSFKVKQNQLFRQGAVSSPCTHADLSLRSSQPDNYELFCEYIPVSTSAEKSEKVAATIQKRLGQEFYEVLLTAILSIPLSDTAGIDKADAAYHTVALALSSPAAEKVLNHLTDPYIHRIFVLSRATSQEAHHLKGFLRFSELENGVLFSVIHPKNNALPILAEHFTDRLPMENFMILDENHQLAAIHAAGKDFMLVDASGIDPMLFSRYSQTEERYRALWHTFFTHIAIEARINPDLQANNIPKRFWGDTIELASLLS